MLHLTQSSYFADQALPLELIRRCPQTPYPLHTHEFSELVIVLSGRGVHFSTTREQLIVAGDVFLIGGNTAHGYRNAHNLVLVNLLFDPTRLTIPERDLRKIPCCPAYRPAAPDSITSRASQVHRRLTGAQLGKTEALIGELERECSEKRPGYRSMATSYFLQIVGHIARSLSEPTAPAHWPEHRIADAVIYMEGNRGRQVRMQELVSRSQMSESTLLRGFKKAVGMPPLRYHLHLKIQRACELLAHTDLPITEVSFQSGFSDSNYFSRQFRKIIRQSPSEYRNGGYLRRTEEFGGQPHA